MSDAERIGAYIAACNAQGFYPAAYYPHNIHFLWAASSMEGRSAIAIEAARKVAANVRLEMIEQFPGVEFFNTIPLLALAQFGRWDEVLAEPQPPAKLEYSNAIWHYVRATAYARKGDLDAARDEHGKFTPLRDATDVIFLDSIYYPATMLLTIADALVRVPRNGWSMYGLIQALKAQDKDVTEIEERFARTWAQADITLTASTY